MGRLRRVAAGKRQQDVAAQVGISTTRYGAIERGEQKATDLESGLIDPLLPELPSYTPNTKMPGGAEL
jgi:transcriptional regulator with XRE-family HTH domain